MIYKSIILIIIALVAATFTASHFSSPPSNLGLTGGRLSQCPKSPNCVFSDAPDEQHAVRPFNAAGKTAIVMNQLACCIGKLGGRIITQDGPYLHAEFRSKIFRFVDDLECLYNEDKELVEVRSAARLGYSDFSVNRKRMEELRELFENINKK